MAGSQLLGWPISVIVGAERPLTIRPTPAYTYYVKRNSAGISLLSRQFLALMMPLHLMAANEFAVATVKVANGGPRTAIYSAPGGKFRAENISLQAIIAAAYDVKEFQIVGGPAWVRSLPFDVEGKADGNAKFEAMKPMVRSLLADRFKLAMHPETRAFQIYQLVKAKNGLKLSSTKEGSCVTPDSNTPLPGGRAGTSRSVLCDTVRMGKGSIHAAAISMARLTQVLSEILGRTVVDQTDHTGLFDVHLEFAQDEAIANPIVRGSVGPGTTTTADSSKPSILTAVQEQLGLKLESTKGPVQILVIDNATKPGPN